MIKESIIKRIDEYLDVDSEHMKHDKVRDLLWDIRGYIKELEFDNWQKLEAIKEYDIKIKKFKRMLDVALES